MRSKHGNTITSCPIYGTFHSKLERAHFENLLLLQKAGAIVGEIERQILFKLYVNGEYVCQIKPDFRYTLAGDARPTIDEVKGYPSRDWPIRWALLQALYKNEYNFIVTRDAAIRNNRYRTRRRAR